MFNPKDFKEIFFKPVIYVYPHIQHFQYISFLPLDLFFHMCQFPLTRGILYNISCSVNLLALNSLSDCLPENVFISLYFWRKFLLDIEF